MPSHPTVELATLEDMAREIEALRTRTQFLEAKVPQNSYKRKVDDGHQHYQPVEGMDDDVSLGFGYQINWRHGLDASRDSWPTNRRFDVDAVGGVCFDYIVDTNWTGTEGQAIETTGGGTTTFFSTVEAAVDDGIANISRAFSILVCPGTYNEVVTTEAFSQEIHIWGWGRDVVTIGGSNGNMQIAAQVWLHHLTLTGTVGTSFCLEQLSGSNGMELHADNVRFAKKMAGDHSGSQFFDCEWSQGIDFQSAAEAPGGDADSPDSVTIFGGFCNGDIDFTEATGASGWQVHGLRMNSGSLILDNVSSSHFAIRFQSGGAAKNDQVLFSGTNSASITLDCTFGKMEAGGQVVRVASGTDAEAVALRGTFSLSTGVANASNRFIKVEGTANSWHVDCAFADDGAGDTVEEQSPAGKSVSGVFINSKFTLVPTTAEVNTTSGSSGNIVDSGVITSGSVGTTPINENILTLTVEDPTNSEDITKTFIFSAITIQEIQAVVVGSSTPSVTINPKHSTDRSAAGNAILSAATAITNTTTGQNLTSFNDATIPADSWVWLETTAQSGKVDEVPITMKFKYD